MLSDHQTCMVGDDESCSGYGLESAHFVRAFVDAMVDSVGAVLRGRAELACNRRN
ncbi:MAG TPA: hypothetical protein VKK81_12760 [Candidatus Binatia bacterium]|nr:hypothetical protein [Candidatus Binatia bacterium]